MIERNEDPTAGGFNGLKSPERTLESSWYIDPTHYQRELAAIWRRNWIYLCRADSLPAAPSFRSFTIGDQPIIVVRDRDDTLRAFFNTCRHRGSTLCPSAEGRLPTGYITCPYHAWSYKLDGSLAKIPSNRPEGYLQQSEISLYSVALRVWRGFVYVRLSDTTHAADGHFNENRDLFGHWPLEDLVVGRTMTKRLACNWKVFWENYNECLHCPGVHPALSSLVPIYKRGIMEPRDDPQWRAHEGKADALYAGGLKAGAKTWSLDGKPIGPSFPQLNEEEQRLGYHYMTSLPSHYLVLACGSRTLIAPAAGRSGGDGARDPVAVSEGDAGGSFRRHRQRLRFLRASHERGRRGLRIDTARSSFGAAQARLPAARGLRRVPLPAVGASTAGLNGAAQTRPLPRASTCSMPPTTGTPPYYFTDGGIAGAPRTLKVTLNFKF